MSHGVCFPIGTMFLNFGLKVCEFEDKFWSGSIFALSVCLAVDFFLSGCRTDRLSHDCLSVPLVLYPERIGIHTRTDETVSKVRPSILELHACSLSWKMVLPSLELLIITVNHDAISTKCSRCFLASLVQATVAFLLASVQQQPHGLVTAGFVTSTLVPHISFSQRPIFFFRYLYFLAHFRWPRSTFVPAVWSLSSRHKAGFLTESIFMRVCVEQAFPEAAFSQVMHDQLYLMCVLGPVWLTMLLHVCKKMPLGTKIFPAGPAAGKKKHLILITGDYYCGCILSAWRVSKPVFNFTVVPRLYENVVVLAWDRLVPGWNCAELFMFFNI